MSAKPRIHLALDFSWTQVEGDWRQPSSWVNRHYPDVGLFEDLARFAERGTAADRQYPAASRGAAGGYRRLGRR